MTGTTPNRCLPAEPGTYVLVMSLDRHAAIRVGRLGTARFRPGFYAYVGSALGPGGIAARVGRHARGGGAVHWHIDYLRRVAPVQEAWYTTGHVRREHAWARALETLSRGPSIAGFGASDCRCSSHLVYFGRPPEIADFRRAVRGSGSKRARFRGSPSRRAELLERTTFA